MLTPLHTNLKRRTHVCGYCGVSFRYSDVEMKYFHMGDTRGGVKGLWMVRCKNPDCGRYVKVPPKPPKKG